MWAEPWSPMPSPAAPTSPPTASATSATPRAAGPAGPLSTRTGSASSGGRPSSSILRPASASTTRSGSASRARTPSPRWPAPPGCTCSMPTASPSPRCTSPRPPATRPASCWGRPGAWSSAARSCSIDSSRIGTRSSAPATAGSCARCRPTVPSSTGSTPRPTSSTSSTPTSRAELYTALTTGTGAREQPFTLWITTAGVAGEGILAELFDSMFTGSGELEDRGSLLIYRDRTNGTLIYWYGAPRDADIEDPAVWYAANPVSWLHDGKYLGAQFARLRARGALLEWRRYHLNQFVGFEDTWLRDGAWRATAGDLPLNVALPIGVGIDRSPDGSLGAIAVAQRQGDRVVVRAQVFAPESATGMASAEAMRVRLRELRLEFPLAAVPRREDEAGARRTRLRVRPPGVRRVGRDPRAGRARHGRRPDDRGRHGPALDPRRTSSSRPGAWSTTATRSSRSTSPTRPRS